MNEEVEREARRLYDACQTPKPTWDQLGDVTKSVWRERVVLATAPATAASEERSPERDSGGAQQQVDLFA